MGKAPEDTQMTRYIQTQQRWKWCLKPLVLFIVFSSGLVIFASPSAYAQTITIDRPTIERGYTLRSGSGSFAVGVWPKTIKEAAQIRLERVSLPGAVPAGTTLVSDVWLFDILKANRSGKDPFLLSRPLTLSLAYSSKTLYRKRLYFWNGTNQSWLPIPSSSDAAEPVLRGAIQLPFAIVAVLEDAGGVQGKASWFRHRFGDSAASNDYPMGSRLRVTNLENGRSVDVIVRSAGPFVAGRVLDLASTAFQKIHPLWKGVAFVRAKLLST